MTSDVVLSAALRNNLLSLQGTQKGIDATQFRLSTGKKVNSALDNPQSFFAAQALTNRASDLTKLLDGIGQSIQVIKAADNGVTALTNLINQAQSIATSAQDALASASTTAKVTGTVSLDGTKTWNTITGLGTNNVITINVTDPTGGTNKLVNQTYTVAASDTVNDVITKINDLNTTNNLTTPAISASLDSSGKLVFEAVNGGNLSVQFSDIAAQTDAGSLAVANALGFANIAKLNKNGNGTTGDIVGFTAVASNSLASSGLYTAVGTVAQGTTLVKDVLNSAGTSLVTAVATDTLKLSVGGKLSADLLHYVNGTFSGTATTTTIQNLVDAINHDSTISTLVSASFDTTTGKISLTPISASATDVQFQVTSAAAGSKYNLGFGVNTLQTAAVGLAAQETIRFGAAAGTLGSLQTQYTSVLSQIDSLVTNGDTGYRGTNLLNGNNLITTFNEGRTSKLVTSGATFNSSGLGLKAANFNSSASVTTTLTQVSSALSTVRNFGSALANDLATIQTRQDFTNNLINTLKTGSDALTNADQNEEGAKLLALQTRQSLGVTALSLASQSQQSILRLFG